MRLRRSLDVVEQGGGENRPGKLADELERTAAGGNAETRAIFDPTIKRLRRLGPADLDPGAPTAREP